MSGVDPLQLTAVYDFPAEHWRTLNGTELAKELLNDVTFKDGKRVTDDEATTSDGRVATCTYLKRRSTTFDYRSAGDHTQ